MNLLVRRRRLAGTRRTVAALALTGAVLGIAASPSWAAPAPVPITSTSCPGNMSQGEVDGCVVSLQQLLNANGASLTVDGNFGPDSTTAVRTYQSAHGLAADGIVGVATKASLVGGSGTSLIGCGTLQQGSSGACVQDLQRLLNNYGAGLAVDGDFGQGTVTAVRNFQSGHGLAVDGIVGPATAGALDTDQYGDSDNVDLRTSCGVLATGSTGNCVRSLQTLLNSHGASLTVDGDFGPATDSTVRNFQTSHGLSADGQVGADTKAALYATGSGSGTPTGSGPVDLRTSCGILAEGSSGACVSTLQQLLNGKGYSLTADGNFGSATDSAVRSFQARAGLQVDGQVGANTKDALYGATPPPLPTGNGSRDAIASKALGELGKTGWSDECNPYTSICENWCSDFATWVWGKAGVNTDGLTPGAISFYWWGVSHHSLENPGVFRVGDAIVWADNTSDARHVALVEAVDSSGRVLEIGGNQGGSPGKVSEWPWMNPSNLGSYYGHPVLAVISPIADGQTHG
ncbi:NlpC/P60 family protein [Streptomyces sp. NPDC054933]